MYEYGLGVSKNIEKSLEYYKKGSSLGDKYSKYNLAIYYKLGIEIEKDLSMAIKLLEECASLGNVNAINYLATIYLYDLNDLKGLQYLEQNIKRNDVDSLIYLSKYILDRKFDLKINDWRNQPKDIQLEYIKLFLTGIEHGSLYALTEIEFGMPYISNDISQYIREETFKLAMNGYQKCNANKYDKFDYIKIMNSLLDPTKKSNLLFEEIINLQSKIIDLENQIYYLPDGPGYLEAKNDFIVNSLRHGKKLNTI